MWFSGLAKRHNLSERLAETISDDRKAASTAENAESLFRKIELILSVHKLVISDIYAVDEVRGRLVRQRKLKKVVPKGAQHPRVRGDLLAKWTKTPRQVVACVGGDGTLIPRLGSSSLLRTTETSHEVSMSVLMKMNSLCTGQWKNGH